MGATRYLCKVNAMASANARPRIRRRDESPDGDLSLPRPLRALASPGGASTPPPTLRVSSSRRSRKRAYARHEKTRKIPFFDCNLSLRLISSKAYKPLRRDAAHKTRSVVRQRAECSWSRVSAKRNCRHIWNRICGIAAMLICRALAHNNLGASIDGAGAYFDETTTASIWYN